VNGEWLTLKQVQLPLTDHATHFLTWSNEMTDPEQIKTWIENGMSCEHVEVQGDGHHFEAVIVSPAFRGKSRVQQHQIVYEALKAEMGGKLHALALQTGTPER
jgi:acid stress-induced BolA-like protein IbaG/YrbA